MAEIGSFSKTLMEAVVGVILLVAVCIPVISGMGAVTGPNADIINTLINIIPVFLAIAIILGVVYAVIIRSRD